MKWAMEMVVDLGVAQQELSGTRDTSSTDWHRVPGGTTYHFPSVSVDYNWDGTVERAHSLGESQSASVANHLMEKLFGFSWYGICTRDH